MVRKDDTNILVLGDIHLGVDYNGKYNTKAQFDAVINRAHSTLPSGYDAVVFNGDLASENAPVDVYLQILKQGKKLCKPEGRVLVTPGNHDNREALSQAYASINPEDFHEAMSLKVPGRQFSHIHVGSLTVILLDSGDGMPMEGIARLGKFAYVTNSSFNRPDVVMFTHRPFECPGHLYHRFMNDKMLPPEMGEYVEQYIGTYVASHLHCESRFETRGFVTEVTPGIQCQIDPFRKEFDGIAMPGFTVLSASRHCNATIDFDTFYVEEPNG